MQFFKSISKELRSFIILLALFFLVQKLVVLIDPTSGTIDAGWFQVQIAGLLQSAFGLVGVWLLLETAFPTFRDYVNLKVFRTDFLALEPWQRVRAFLCMFAVVLWFVVQCLK